MTGGETVRAQRTPRSGGFSIIYVALIFLILMAFVAFAVDVGRMRLARNELQGAADASARAGCSGLSVGTTEVRTRALSFATKNQCLGDPVSIDTVADIDFGIWSVKAHSFTVLPPDRLREANSIRVTTKRIAERGNAIKLFFAPVLGQFANNIQTPATAYIYGWTSRFGIVGLEWLKSGGNVMYDSYNGTNGYPGSGAANQHADIATNGHIDFKGNVTVNGEAHWGHDPGDADGYDEYLYKNGTVNITGWQAPLDTDIVYPLPLLPGQVGTPVLRPTLTNNDNALIDNTQLVYDPATMALFMKGLPANDPKVFNLVGSNDSRNPRAYYFSSIEVQQNWTWNIGPGYVDIVCMGDFIGRSNATINNLGKLRLWVNGNFNVAGGIKMTSTNAANLQIYMTSSNTSLYLGGNTAIYGQISAPGSNVAIDGTSDFYGAVVGRTLDFSGTPRIHYDESLGIANNPGYVTLVK